MLRVEGKLNTSAATSISRSTGCICRSRAMRIIELTCTPIGTSLLDLMEKSVDLQCEEPRDRVYALCGLATAEAASIDRNYENDLPVFFNTLFRHHIEQVPEISISTVTSTCHRLESLFGTIPGTIFELHSPTNHLPEQPGLIYHRLCTHSINMPGLTLLWAIHYEHVRVQEVIKMVHCLQIPSSDQTFCCFLAVGSIIALYLVVEVIYLGQKIEDWSSLTHSIETGTIIVHAATVIIPAIMMYELCRTSLRPWETVYQAGRNGKWRVVHMWFPSTALERSTWTYLWWILFIVSEISIYIAAQALRPLKLWSLGFYFRGRHEEHGERGHTDLFSQNNVEHEWT